MCIVVVKLEKVCNENLSYYFEYEKAYDNDLKNYQSRIYPSSDAQYLHWYHIKADGKYIGAIWLEKASTEDFSVLGLFIADENYRNKGIGPEAITHIMRDLPCMHTNKILLRVRQDNERAIRCYKKVGFEEYRQYVKNDFNVLEMIYMSKIDTL